MTKALIKAWLHDVYFPSVGNESHLVVDALTQYGDLINIDDTVPAVGTFELKRIPAGATSRVQPLDVGFFRSWKQFVRRISDRALIEGEVDMFQRDNIIKLQSLVHFQFSAPIYSDMIRYAWYKSGLVQTRPPTFETPLQFCFPQEVHHCKQCTRFMFMKCSWCHDFFCFNHFFVQYHICH